MDTKKLLHWSIIIFFITLSLCTVSVTVTFRKPTITCTYKGHQYQTRVSDEREGADVVLDFGHALIEAKGTHAYE